MIRAGELWQICSAVIKLTGMGRMALLQKRFAALVVAEDLDRGHVVLTLLATVTTKPLKMP